MMSIGNSTALMSSDKQDWGTPQAFVDWLQEAYMFQFDLDVCAHADNNKVPNYFTLEDNCLETEWFGNHVWMNPPFGRELPKFIDRAINQIEEGNVGNVWILVPARTDTKWCHRLINHKSICKVMFFKGRFNFDFKRNLKGSNAPFPSMLVQLRQNSAPHRMRTPRIKFCEIPKEARGF